MNELGLEGKDKLPGLYQSADTASITGRRHYFRAFGLRLVFVALAATASAMPLGHLGELEVSPLLTAILFFAAISVEIWLLQEKPTEAWYDGRALAESTKTLAWRYAVRGKPFDISDSDADVRIVSDLRNLLADAPDTSIEPSSAPVITEAMKALRKSSLTDRREIYLRDRVEDQQSWYHDKAKQNSVRARRWRLTLIVAESLGVVAAGIKAFTAVPIDLAGLVAAAVAAGAAWLAAQQHDSLARAYTFAAEELNIVRDELRHVISQEEWSQKMADAEEAISREHTMWRASRCSPSFARRLRRFPK
ncbi:DUF4231 domain-containing protein [Micromonospora profundi]|uniref:DUF4231 domain-containing protein n=1 Tax=Micromonospora profundi TaxID=1420889 RepID=UPI0037F7FEA0